MAEKLRTDLATSTDRGLHPGQHNEINTRFLALETAVTAGTATGPANDLPAQDGDYDAHGYRLRNLGAPVTGGDAATKAYADAAAGAMAPKPANLLPAQTGNYDARGFRITALATPTAGTDAATKAYADAAGAQPINSLPAQTGDYDTRGYRIIGLPPPTDNTAAATKRYTDEAIAAIPEVVPVPVNQLPDQTGDYDAHGFRFTGLNGPVSDTDAATKRYADDAAASAAAGVVVPAPVPINSLPPQSGDYQARGFKLTGLAAPVSDTDAATKRYADDAAASVVVPVIPPANDLPNQTADYSARGFRLTSLAPPIAGTDAATKKYTDDLLALYSGGTATPANKLPAQDGDYDAQTFGITNLRPPVSATDAATKKYTDDAIAAVPSGGGGGTAVPVNDLPAQTADYDARGFTITGLETPTGDTDAATKKYTDDTVTAATEDFPQLLTDFGDLQTAVGDLQTDVTDADLPGMRSDIDDLTEALAAVPAPLARQTTSFPLGPIASGATATGWLTLSPSFTLLAITVSAASVRFRAYVSTAHAAADAARAVTTPATPAAGLILEYVSTDSARHYLSPVPTGYTTDPASNDVAIAVTNTGTSGPVTVELVWMALEKVAA